MNTQQKEEMFGSTESSLGGREFEVNVPLNPHLLPKSKFVIYIGASLCQVG